jgi:hypothetical protein
MQSSTCFGRHIAHHQELETALAASGFVYVKGCWTLRLLDAVRWSMNCDFELLMMGGVSPKTCWASYTHGIINFDTLLHLVGCIYTNYNMMHGSTNIKHLRNGKRRQNVIQINRTGQQNMQNSVYLCGQNFTAKVKRTQIQKILTFLEYASDVPEKALLL